MPQPPSRYCGVVLSLVMTAFRRGAEHRLAHYQATTRVKGGSHFLSSFQSESRLVVIIRKKAENNPESRLALVVQQR